MKKLFFFFWLQSLLHAYSIVFVHIGNQIPDYVPIAIDQARLFNPTSSIYLIANKKALQKASFSLEKNVEQVSCESLEKSASHRLFLYTSGLDRSAFEGFWTFTSERFFYLEELIRQKNLTDVFHLENDVMVYVDLGSLLPIFQNRYQGMIAATFDSDTRCIPGFMYICSPKPIEELVQFMASQAVSGKNDMQTIQAFRELHSGSYIDSLPIITPHYVEKWGLKNLLGARTISPESYTRYFGEFQSIFDAAAIGQYLGGISPRNGAGSIGFINETCLFNPSHLKFQWIKDEQGRKVPYLLQQGGKCRINNLHIHSKNLALFYSGKP